MSPEFVRTQPGSDPIIVEGYFAVAPAEMYAAWTDPDIVMKWFGPVPNSLHSATIDLRQGGTWQFLEAQDAEKSISFEGEYLEIEPGSRLVFAWSKITVYATGERDSTPASQVEVNFTAKGGGTDVRVIHSAMDSEATRKGFAGGWEFAFKSMSALLT